MRILKTMLREICLLAFAISFASAAFAANVQEELRTSLQKLSESVENATAVVGRIRAGNLEISADLRQDYLAEFVRYKEAKLATVQAVQQARENASASNLYSLRRQLGELDRQLQAISLWVYLGTKRMPESPNKNEELQAIDQSEQDFRTQVFLYDLVVGNILAGR